MTERIARTAWGEVVHADQPAMGGLARDCFGREVRVADDDVVAMPHGPQHIQHIGVQRRIDSVQQSFLPFSRFEWHAISAGFRIACNAPDEPAAMTVAHRMATAQHRHLT